MRNTSARRRNSYGAKVYRGAVKLAAREQATDITTDDADAVECGYCGASVKPLASNPDRPKAHAPGGLTTNTRLGRYKCPGSGNDGSTYAS
jgi:hypothetical protein